MKKIKKSILTAVLGFVMCLSVVFGVAVGVRNNRTAKAYVEDAELANSFQRIMSVYFQKNNGFQTVAYDTSILAGGALENRTDVVTGVEYKYTSYLNAYEEVKNLVETLEFGTEGLKTFEEITDVYNSDVASAYDRYIDMRLTVFAEPEAVAEEINTKLAKFANEDYVVVWDDVELYETVSGHYNRLDTDFRNYNKPTWQKVVVGEGVNYQKDYAGTLPGFEYLAVAKAKIDAFLAELNAVIAEINGTENDTQLGGMLERGVLIADADRYAEVVADYNKYADDAGAKAYIDSKLNTDDEGHDNIYLVGEELKRLIGQANEVIRKIGYYTVKNPIIVAEDFEEGDIVPEYVEGELGSWIASGETLAAEIEDPYTDEIIEIVNVGVKYKNEEAFYEYIGDLSGVNPEATSMYLALNEDQQEYVKAHAHWRNVDVVRAALKTIHKKMNIAIAEINAVGLNTTVVYSLKPNYDVAFEAYDALKNDDEAQEYVRLNSYYAEFQKVQEGLEELETRAEAVDAVLAELEYYLNHELAAGLEGEIVKDSQSSMEAVKNALAAVYNQTTLGEVNGLTFTIPAMDYKWTDAEVKAFQDYGYLTNLEAYDNAVEVIAAYEQKAAEVNQQIADARNEVDTAESYKVKDETIEEAYEAYVELRHEDMWTGTEEDPTLVNDWSDVENAETAVAMHETLNTVKGYIVEVANMLGRFEEDSYEYTIDEFMNAEAIVNDAYAALPDYPFVFDISDEVFVDRVDELIAMYEAWTDEFEKNDTEKAYEVLKALQQAIKDEKDAKEELLEDLASLEELLDAVRFSYIYNVNEIMGKAFKLQEATLRSFTIDEVKYLETLAYALGTLYSRAYDVDIAIANIYLYNGEVVYNSMDSVDAVTELLAKVYYNETEDGYVYTVEDYQYNEELEVYEVVATREVPYKFAEFDYTYDAENKEWTRWDEEKVELAAFQDETAYYLLVDDATGLLLNIEDYEKAVETLEAYKAVAKAVREDVETLVNELSPEKNYKVKETVINDLYDRYIDLLHEEYEGKNDWTQYVPEAGQILNVKTVLDALNAWIERVADAIVPGTAGQPAADNVIDAATADPTMVNLTLAQVKDLLHNADYGYDQLVFDHIDEEEKVVNDLIKVASVEKAHALLVARYTDLIEEGEQLQEEIDALETILLEDGVRYSDRDVYEDLVARIAALDPDVAAEIELDKTNVDTLGEALDDLKSRLENAWLEFVQMILYRVGDEDYYMDKDPAGTIVYASDDYEDTHSIAEAIEAVNAVYDGKFNEAGTYKIAYYPYDLVREVVVEYNTYKYGNTTEDGYEWTRWTEEDLAAMYKEGDLFVLSADELNALLIRYENAVEDFEDLRYEAKAVSDDIYTFEVTNYKEQKAEIEALREAYNALDHGDFDNLQPWVDDAKLVDIENKLHDVYNWIKKVASLVDADATVDTADGIIDDALVAAKAETLEVVVSLDTIEEYLEEYERVVKDKNDDEDAHYPYEEYEDADSRVAALEDAKELLDYLQAYREKAIQEAINALNELVTDNITYRYHDDYVEAQRLYEEFKDDAAAIAMIQDGLDDKNHTPEEVLEIVGGALATIENSTKAAGSLIGTIVYYNIQTKTLESGLDVVDEEKYAVVYASKDSIKAVHEAFNNIYNGDGHIANLPFGQVSEDEMAYLRNMVVEDEEVFANVDEFIKAFEALKALRLQARDVENGIKALMGEEVENVFGLVALDYDNNYKAQEVGINNLKAKFDLIKYPEVPSQWNDLTQWIGANYQEYLAYVVENLNEVNAWIYKVADAVTEEATVTTADAIIAAEVGKDYADDWSFRLEEILGAYNAYVALMEKEVAEEPAKEGSLAEAKAVLDALYARMREVNNDLATEIKDLLVILSNKNLLNEKDYNELQEIYNRAEAVRTNYRKLSERQQAQLQTFEPYGEAYQTGLRVPNPEIVWLTIRPNTYRDFENAVGNFERALYFKQATDELFEKVGMDEENPHYTVEGYVLNKMLLSMYWTFDPEVREQVQSSYEKLMRITEGLDAEKAKENDDDPDTQSAIVDYEQVIKEVLGAEEGATLEEALNKYQEDNKTAAQAAENAAQAAENAAQAAADAAQAAADAAEAQAAAETAQGLAEDALATADEKAQAAETAAQAAVDAQAAAETAKGLAEAAQAAAETAKTDAEKAQAAAETAKGLAETARELADNAKADANTSASVAAAAELAAQTAEANAKTAETNAQTAEANAKTAEANAKTAEANAAQAKVDAETAQTAAEAAKDAAVEAQGKAEDAKDAAEKAKTDAENAAQAAHTAQVEAVAAQKAAEDAKDAAEKAKTEAENAKKTADEKATEAAEAQDAAKKAQDEADRIKADTTKTKDEVDAAQKAADAAKKTADEKAAEAAEAQEAANAKATAAAQAKTAAENAAKAAKEAQAKAEAAQAAAEKARDEKNDATNERVSKLKKALIITAVVGGVVAVGAVAGIVVLFGKTSALAVGAASSSAASGSGKAGKEDEE